MVFQHRLKAQRSVRGKGKIAIITESAYKAEKKKAKKTAKTERKEIRIKKNLSREHKLKKSQGKTLSDENIDNKKDKNKKRRKITRK